MGKSKILWTDDTWGPTTGCDPISCGCDHCYAKKMAIRLKGMGNPAYKNGFKVTLQPERLGNPLKWKKGRMIFVDSMGDLFHDDVPGEYILKVFEVMNQCPQHIFQILTKRPDRIISLNSQITWTDNIWMGVTVESQEYVDRIIKLRFTSAKNKFASFEPLLGPIHNFRYQYLDWIIVGGENGRGARPMKELWAADILMKARARDIPFFFKQMGGTGKDKGGPYLYDRIYHEYPEPMEKIIEGRRPASLFDAKNHAKKRKSGLKEITAIKDR